MRQSCKELKASSATRFSNGSAKVRLFSSLPNLFHRTEGQKNGREHPTTGMSRP